MIENQVSTQPGAVPSGDLRVCGRCGRPLLALHKDEYTPARALLVAASGLCLCPTGGPDGVPQIPDHAPSLM
jgi:hypothetical protein